MKYILLSPHNDDETLFASFLCLRYDPVVIVCLRSHVQEQRGTGITFLQREAETACAMSELGVTEWRQWPIFDSEPLPLLERWLTESLTDLFEPDLHVFAPQPEPDGHEHHNLIGELADEIFGVDNVTHYLTYTEGIKHSTWGHQMEYEPHWPALKLRALACYETQIQHPSTGHHFMGGIREYIVA